jgi:hypothetical protein
MPLSANAAQCDRCAENREQPGIGGELGAGLRYRSFVVDEGTLSAVAEELRALMTDAELLMRAVSLSKNRAEQKRLLVRLDRVRGDGDRLVTALLLSELQQKRTRALS